MKEKKRLSETMRAIWFSLVLLIGYTLASYALFSNGLIKMARFSTLLTSFPIIEFVSDVKKLIEGIKYNKSIK